MNWKRFYLVFLAFATSTIAFSQANLLNAKKVEEIGKRTQEQIKLDIDKPLPYGYISDRCFMV